MIKITIKSEIYPTENIDIIKDIFNLFFEFQELIPKKKKHSDNYELIATIEDQKALDFLFNQVRKQRIVEAIRQRMLNRMDINNHSCKILLNKQALTVGKIHLCDTKSESPLGPITILIQADNIESVVNYLFPPTVKGNVIELEKKPIF